MMKCMKAMLAVSWRVLTHDNVSFPVDAITLSVVTSKMMFLVLQE